MSLFGQCSCSAESLGCATGDTVNPSSQFPATDAAGNPIPGAGCVLPPGWDNCLSFSGDLSPCDVDRIQRTRRRFVVSDDDDTGNLQDVTALYSAELDTPPGHTWWRVVIQPIGVSHQICPRSFTAEHRLPAVGWVDYTNQIVEVAVAAERIYQDGDGGYVHGGTWPRPADPDDLTITDGRCACERLCECVTYFGQASVAVLLPDVPVAEATRITVRGVRDCWQIQCGSCPPELLCGREVRTDI